MITVLSSTVTCRSRSACSGPVLFRHDASSPRLLRFQIALLFYDVPAKPTLHATANLNWRVDLTIIDHVLEGSVAAPEIFIADHFRASVKPIGGNRCCVCLLRGSVGLCWLRLSLTFSLWHLASPLMRRMPKNRKAIRRCFCVR